MRELFAKIFDKTFWKFIVVGVINTLFGTAVMFGCYNLLHFGYWVSSAANYILGSILSYFLNRSFTFRSNEKGAGQLARFGVNIILCYLVAYGAARPAVRWALSGAGTAVQDNGALLVGMCLFVLLNYFGQRFFVFAEKKKEEE